MNRGQVQEHYVANLYQLHETELMRNVKSRLASSDKAKMSIGITEGIILKYYSAQDSVSKIVEIGTLYGYSTLWFYEGLKKGTIFTFEKDANHIAEAKKTFSQIEFCDKKICLIEGDASQTLDNILDQAPFDLIFIDANKVGYERYFNWSLKNLSPGGHIIIDNAYLFGSVWDDNLEVPTKMRETMRGLNKRIAEDKSLLSFSIPTSEGMTVVRKK